MIEHEWLNEPDSVEFEHAGLKCKIIRQGAWSKHLCGYVEVTKEHQWHGLSYNDVDDVNVHGGLTFSGTLKQDPDNYYFGFDCAHCYDIQPARAERGDTIFVDGQYRNIAYVTQECKNLADQIALANIPVTPEMKAFKEAYKNLKEDYHGDHEAAKLMWDAAIAFAKENSQ